MTLGPVGDAFAQRTGPRPVGPHERYEDGEESQRGATSRIWSGRSADDTESFQSVSPVYKTYCINTVVVFYAGGSGGSPGRVIAVSSIWSDPLLYRPSD